MAANPHDSLPRLICADWLNENGWDEEESYQRDGGLGRRVVTHYAFCETHQLKHAVRANNIGEALGAYSDWKEKHRLKDGCVTGLRSLGRNGLVGYGHNSDVKEAFQAEQTLTVTNLHSLPSSATAGWTSGSVDNTTNLYPDASVVIHVAPVNTAPASDKAIYVFAYGSQDGAIFTSTGTSGGTVGTEGSLTFPSISTLAPVMPLIGIIPYPVQNKAIDAGPFYLSTAFRKLPKYWGLAILNFSGMTFAASANTVKYMGCYDTVI